MNPFVWNRRTDDTARAWGLDFGPFALVVLTDMLSKSNRILQEDRSRILDHLELRNIDLPEAMRLLREATARHNERCR